MTWQTCLRFVTRRRVPVLATAPDRAETSTRVRPMHDLTRLEVLQLLLCNFRTGTRLRLDSFVPRESTVGPRDSVLQQDKSLAAVHASETLSTVCSRGAEFARYADVSDDAATFTICSARRGPGTRPVWARNSQV